MTFGRFSRRQPLSVPLKRFEMEQCLPSGDPAWPQVTQYQRDGLVRLRWPERAGGICYVSLTEKGRKEVGG